MDVDFSLILRDVPIPKEIEWGDLNIVERGDSVHIRDYLENISGDLNELVMSFLSRIMTICPDCISWAYLCELAFYFDVDQSAHFAVQLEPRFLDFLGARNIGLRVIAYPCTDDSQPLNTM